MFWRRLLHRWLIEYNPLYLLSAALVLGGVNQISRNLSQESAVAGQLGVAQWGMTSVGFGFGLLLISLAASWRLRKAAINELD
jgi:hypothetical protein